MLLRETLRVFTAVFALGISGVYMFLFREPVFFASSDTGTLVRKLVEETGAVNAVSAVYLGTRLYDTVFEFLVFAIAASGVAMYARFLGVAREMSYLSDPATAITLRLLSFLALLAGMYLALFGHLSPGGGFAAGVAGGTAFFLWAIAGGFTTLDVRIRRLRGHVLEWVCITAFLLCTLFDFWGVSLPRGTPGALASGGYIPLYNLLVFLKVTLGSWGIAYHFIRSRGIL